MPNTEFIVILLSFETRDDGFCALPPFTTFGNSHQHFRSQ